MTPLHLDILMHYYSRTGDYELIPGNQTRTDYAFELASLGLLYSPKVDRKPTQLFEITKHGKNILAKCLTILSNEE